MLNNSIVSDETLNTFIKEVVENEVVFTLTNKEANESAMCASMDFSDDEGEDCAVLCFWSSMERAQLCQRDEWKDFDIESIDLGEFLENWCLGMAMDQVIPSLNFDQDLSGQEEEAIHLAILILNELDQQQKELPLEKSASVAEYKSELESLL
ncbi:hypothetical protein OURE66S_01656 [Oligella ureolytica]